MDTASKERKGRNLAELGVNYDTKGMKKLALFYYTEAIDCLYDALQDGSQLTGLAAKIDEYLTRAEQLKAELAPPQDTTSTPTIGFVLPQECTPLVPTAPPFEASSSPSISRRGSNEVTPNPETVKKAKVLLQQAMQEDETGDPNDALKLYMSAAELSIKTKKMFEKGSSDEKELESLATTAIDRAEGIKKELSGPPPKNQSQSSAGYTKLEIGVLRKTSKINKTEFLPFIDEDLKERFALGHQFSDPDGILPLAKKQQNSFHKFARISELSAEPAIICSLSPLSVNQTVVSDCSFVSSLAISAQLEKKFGRKLLTHRIYPQNRRTHMPVYNPCGKYMVKLNLNGIERKIIIDDRLPVGRHGQLLCSFSTNPNEFWVSLLEKAYMKVMGGYDFPGSNSGIDLNALSGWIPERLSIKDDDRFDKVIEFNRLKSRFHAGHCLITIATGNLGDAEADRAGLVPTHAYAILDIREVEGWRLFLVKNPWNHLSWKGRFSASDSEHWTPSLRTALKYSPQTSKLHDNGLFWIDLDSLCHFFDVFYISWDPSLFPYTTCFHDVWPAFEGPKKDVYSVCDNPQFSLTVDSSTVASSCWLLLSRHITDIDDFANNRIFLCLVVYENNGKKVVYSSDPAPLVEGVRINSPHVLTKLNLPPSSTPRHYTIVVSQYEKNESIFFTLRAYSSVKFALKPFPDIFPAAHNQQLTHEWKGFTAGGCQNNRDTYSNNPKISVQVFKPETAVQFELRVPKQFSGGLALYSSPECTGKPFLDCGTYRSGFVVLECPSLNAGTYFLVPATFSSGQEGPFILTSKSTQQIRLAVVK